ncbi:MAG: ACP S-malonyltransferase [Candidatus Omnitrophica bacterium]|nr:ACP S-malonyltransferase [Candidatus Omnitrophota bacterium]
MKKVTYIFPGQGSQTVGMGKELYDNSPIAKQIFDQAETIVPGLLKVIFEGPEELLTSTKFCQPAIVTVSIAALKAFEAGNIVKEMEPVFACGHSLGEISALVACGALDFKSALELVVKRAECMQKAVEKNPGKMAAVIGFDKLALVEVCRSTGAEVANFNSLDQIVITGKSEAVEAACKIIEEKGAKRVIVLAVAGGFHSSLMKTAGEEFAGFVNQVNFTAPHIAIISNVDAAPTKDAAVIKHNLPQQIYSSVRWVETVQYVQQQGIDTFIEFGTGAVLKGLIKKIDKALNVINVGTCQDTL